MEIAIVGPKLSISYIEDVIEENDFGCKFYVYTYEKLDEILEIYEECKGKVDGMFFSGELGFIYINQKIEDLAIPCKFIAYDTNHVFAVILDFILEYPHIPLNRVYIDFLVPLNNYYGIKEFIKEKHLPICNESNSLSHEDMLNLGKFLWENDKIDMMLTRSISNINNIKESGVPFIPILPTEKMISDAIKTALMEIRVTKTKTDSSIICLVEPVYESEVNINQREYTEVTMYKALVDIKKELNININISQLTGRFELLYYDNEEELNLKNTKYIIDNLKRLDEFDFNLGVGISSSLDESRYLAETALNEAIAYGVNDGFAAYENGDVSGPLSQGSLLTYNIINTRVEKFAKDNSVNVTNMARIVGIYHQNKDEIINSSKLSEWLNITPRSCNRIIQQLLKHQLIEEISIEENKGKGRPALNYKFIQTNMDSVFASSRI